MNTKTFDTTRNPLEINIRKHMQYMLQLEKTINKPLPKCLRPQEEPKLTSIVRNSTQALVYDFDEDAFIIAPDDIPQNITNDEHINNISTASSSSCNITQHVTLSGNSNNFGDEIVKEHSELTQLAKDKDIYDNLVKAKLAQNKIPMLQMAKSCQSHKKETPR